MGTIRIRFHSVIICICHRVSDRDIVREVAAGCPDFATLQAGLKVATGCGRCRQHAEMVFDEQVALRACGGCSGAAHCGAQPLVLPEAQPA